MASKKLTQVKINGTDVSSILFNWRITNTYGDELSYATLEFPSFVTNSVTLDTTATLEIWEGFSAADDKKIFSGFIETFKPDGYKILVFARDKLDDLVRKEITQSYDKT